MNNLLLNIESLKDEIGLWLILLEKIFIANGFEYKKLISKKDMRYRGQKGFNKALMFVLYNLKRYDN